MASANTDSEYGTFQMDPNDVFFATTGSSSESDHDMTDQELISSVLELEMPQHPAATTDTDLDLAVSHADDNVNNRPPTTGIAPSRFPILSDEDMEQIIDKSTSDGTKKQTKYGVAILRKWLQQRNMDTEFENLYPAKLDVILRQFYGEVRNSDGNYYSKSTYVGIRASINRYLRSPPHNKVFSILTDKEFTRSNQMFVSVLKMLKREGFDKTKHHTNISEGDMEKLTHGDVFDLNNPRGLQRKVWFDIMLSFGRRGRENQRKLSVDNFSFQTDDKGFEFVEMSKSEATKNHPGGLKDDDFEKNPRMYATDSRNCPVSALKKYISKRNPSTPHFFQQPRVHISNTDGIWYTSRPLGDRILNDMMKKISIEANLSKIYTNHCVRATTISILAHAGIPSREIMRISGHRCEGSLSSYNTDSSDQQKRLYSSILHRNNTPSPSSSTAQASNSHMVDNGQLNHVHNAKSQLSFPVMFHKQFEIHNSTVQVFNYANSTDHFNQ